MKEFIFYTIEGYTESPTGKAIENMQILDFICGTNEIEARKTLLEKNRWIVKSGFDVNKILCKQVID